MANPLLFRSLLRDAPLANASNQQGAAAFAFIPRHKLAQMVMTGCMNETFYTSGQAQLNDVLATAKDLDDLFLAQLAIYGRERGMMKDMPALLTAILAARGSALLPIVFTRVINNGRMLRNFVQILRSGVTGRRSLGTRPKKRCSVGCRTPAKSVYCRHRWAMRRRWRISSKWYTHGRRRRGRKPSSPG